MVLDRKRRSQSQWRAFGCAHYESIIARLRRAIQPCLIFRGVFFTCITNASVLDDRSILFVVGHDVDDVLTKVVAQNGWSVIEIQVCETSGLYQVNAEKRVRKVSAIFRAQCGSGMIYVVEGVSNILVAVHVVTGYWVCLTP